MSELQPGESLAVFGTADPPGFTVVEPSPEPPSYSCLSTVRSGPLLVSPFYAVFPAHAARAGANMFVDSRVKYQNAERSTFTKAARPSRRVGACETPQTKLLARGHMSRCLDL